MSEIEQLKADIATLEATEELHKRRWGWSVPGLSKDMGEMKAELAKLEKEAADPWVKAKDVIAKWEVYLDGSISENAKAVTGYVRYLESRVAELESELAKRPVVWCVLREGGYLRRRCGCVKTFTDRDKKSSSITQTAFRHYTGEQE